MGDALGAIVSDVSKVTDLIDGISRASQEQAQGVDQINSAVSQMDKVTQQNASGAEECASAAEQMSAEAQAVQSIVNELALMVGGGASAGARSENSKRVGRWELKTKRTPVHAGAVGRGIPAGHSPAVRSGQIPTSTHFCLLPRTAMT